MAALGLKPADYKLSRCKYFQDMWTAPSEADEDAAVKQIEKWWAENGEKAAGKGPGGN